MAIKISDPTLQQLFIAPIRYTIPPYQRRYRWEEEPQWKPLWEDVRDLAEELLASSNQSQSDPHFFGAIVLRPLQHAATEPQNREVIDGQQRLTTIQIMLDAAQAVFQEHSETHANLLAKLILNDEIYTGTDPDYRFKIWPSRYDRDAFRAVMDDRASTDTFADSLIVAAHEYFYNSIKEWIAAGEDDEAQQERCDQLTSALTQRLQFVEIVVETPGMANKIFETLNARGTPLQAWDLVKNYMYEHAGDAPDFEDWFDDELLKFDQEWWQEESGSGRNRRSNVDLFLNHFLVLRTKREVKGRTANDVYRALAAYMEEPAADGEKSVRGVGSDFSRLGETYRHILQAPSSAPHGVFLHQWRVQGNNVLAPVLLWLWSSGVPDDELDLAVRALDSYFGRRLICQSPSKDYRELSIGLLRELSGAGPSQAGKVTKHYLRDRSEGVETLKWPSDDELLSVLETRQMYGKLTVARVRLILEAVERQMRLEAKVAGPLTVGTMSIEHVMPQKWETHWPPPRGRSGNLEETMRQRRERLLHSIGNLTLVTSKLNSKMKNDPWADKRDTLKVHSKLYLSNDLIAHHGEWDEASIIQRSQALGAVLSRAWPPPQAL